MPTTTPTATSWHALVRLMWPETTRIEGDGYFAAFVKCPGVPRIVYLADDRDTGNATWERLHAQAQHYHDRCPRPCYRHVAEWWNLTWWLAEARRLGLIPRASSAGTRRQPVRPRRAAARADKHAVGQTRTPAPRRAPSRGVRA